MSIDQTKPEYEVPDSMTVYYLAILTKGPTWTPEAPGLDELQAAHLANYDRLAAEGKLVLAGPLLDNGFIRGIDIFKADSLAEAQEISASDPMAKINRLIYDLHPWMVKKSALSDPADPSFTGQAWQRKTAADLFNQAWELIDKTDRTPADDLEMIHLAHASRALWNKVGTAVNRARGEWQIAHVYTLVNRSEPALVHAKVCLEICAANHFGDFDLAFAYEALARALACAGDLAGARENTRLAEAAAEQIAEPEDREFFDRALAEGPWFGSK